MIHRYTLLILIVCLAASGCFTKTPSSTNEVRFSNGVDVVQLQNWHFLGPFPKESSSREDIMDIDLLDLEIGKKEAKIKLNDLLKVGSRNTTLKSGLIKTRPQGVNIMNYVAKEEGVVYLFCEINNKTDEEVNFVFSGMQHAKIWLNHQAVYETLWKRVQYKYYEEYVPVKLKKGNNTLLLKLIYSDAESASHWKFNFFVSKKKHANENYLKDYRFSILKKNIVDTALTAYLGPFIREDIEYKIFDNDSNLMVQKAIDKKTNRTGMAAVDLSTLEKDGLYKVEFDIKGKKLEQDFYYGNFDKFLEEISKQYKKVINSGITENDRIGLEASYSRLQFLKDRNNDPELPTSVRAYWDRSRVLYAKELNDFFKSYDNLKTNEGDHFDGLIKTYVSKIDGSKQYYSSYIPESLKQGNKEIPLILLCPFSYTPTPYLKSWYTSNRDQDMWDSKLAEKYGFGLVWLDLRGHPGLNDIAMTAFQEIMADLKKRHNIDEDRIFILGNSSSSRKAITVATRFPSLIAGTIFYGPDVDIAKFDADEYRIENLSNAYLFIQHSKNDEMVPLETVEGVYQQMQSYSKDSYFKIVDKSTHFVTPKDSYRSAFEYIKDKKRNSEPDSITISTSELKYGESYGLRILEKLDDGIATAKIFYEGDTVRVKSKNVNRLELDLKAQRDDLPIILNGTLLRNPVIHNGKLVVTINKEKSEFPFRKNNIVEGPINHAFANKFKIIYGDENESVKDTLNAFWQGTYFNDVRSIRASDVSDEDIQSSNLILIGTKFQSKIAQEIVEQLPIQINQDHITFRGKQINGNDILISFVYPNPLNPDKYIVLIASNSKIRSFPMRDFSNEGDSDFKIFQYRGNRYELVNSGNFDNEWR